MNLQIGISGLDVAQQTLSIIATNIANVATEGYHKQTPLIAANEFVDHHGAVLGGSYISSVIRNMDVLLEQELLRQQLHLGENSEELQSLQSLESALGDLETEGLAAAMGRFFDALQELSGQPDSRALREQVLWAADGLGGKFRSLSAFLDGLAENLRLKADLVVEEVNALSAQVAEFNRQIRSMELAGRNANLLRDKRDEAIRQLAERVPVQVENINPTSLMSDVVAWGTPLVMGGSATEIEIGTQAGGELGISVKGLGYFHTDFRGGRLGALLNLQNEMLPEIRGRLDALAAALISEINRLHVQGVGTAGSFTELQGVVADPVPVDQWEAPVTSGDFRIRLIDPSGGAELLKVTVDAATDTLATIVAKISALDPAHLTASASGSMLTIQALAGYEFDFLPEMIPDTTALGAGAPEVVVEGLYTGPANQVYTATVSVAGGGSGQIGVTDGLTVTVRDGDGQIAKILHVGAGYANGDLLEIQHGMKLSLSTGLLDDGDVFSVEALAYADETGFLAAAGMNTFFDGTCATDIAVRQAMLNDSGLLATALSPEMHDNAAVLRMAEVRETRIAELGDVSPADAFRILVTDVGQKMVVREARRASVEGILQQLANQRDLVSGVDVNEEAARMVVFERMFQAMAKVINTQQTALQSLMDLL